MASDSKPSRFKLLQGSNEKTATKTEKYLHFFEKKSPETKPQKEKAEDTKKMVNNFYDLVTDFYEYGWGESFHFAPIGKGESLKEAILKHELHLATKLALEPDEHVLDLGCGIGGPARNIAQFSKAKITGINNNEYQIKRADTLTEKAGLTHLCTFKTGDFTKLSEPTDSADKVYACEATCHAMVKTDVFNEIFRVLKPGGLFANYDWLLTDKYDPNNAEHNKVVHDIMEGNGLPAIQTIPDYLSDLRAAGFEILEAEDLVPSSAVPWESPLEPGWINISATPVGRMATRSLLYCLEKVGLSPKGSTKVHSTLCLAAESLVKSAKLGIFTPMFFSVVRKPEKKKESEN